MKPSLAALVLTLSLAAAAAAQDDYSTPPATPAAPAKTEAPQPGQPPAPEPAKPAPAAEAPKPPAAKENPRAEAIKQEAPRETPKTVEAKAEEPKSEPKKPAAAAPKKAEAPKELTACARSLQPLADVYQQAFHDMQKFIGEVDVQTAAATERVGKIQEQIRENESSITKAKLESDDARAKDLTRENKQLWNDLTSAKKERGALCAGFARDAAQRVKQYAADASLRLADCKSQMK